MPYLSPTLAPPPPAPEASTDPGATPVSEPLIAWEAASPVSPEAITHAIGIVSETIQAARCLKDNVSVVLAGTADRPHVQFAEFMVSGLIKFGYPPDDFVQKLPAREQQLLSEVSRDGWLNLQGRGQGAVFSGGWVDFPVRLFFRILAVRAQVTVHDNIEGSTWDRAAEGFSPDGCDQFPWFGHWEEIKAQLKKRWIVAGEGSIVIKADVAALNPEIGLFAW